MCTVCHYVQCIAITQYCTVHTVMLEMIVYVYVHTTALFQPVNTGTCTVYMYVHMY